MNTTTQGATAPSVFQFQDSFQLRVIAINGDPWFVAVDLAVILEYRDAANLLRLVDEDERGYSQCEYPLQNQHGEFGTQTQQLSIISQPGLFRVIAVSRSSRARPFQRWLFHEVLPAIFRTGAYIHPAARTASNERGLSEHERRVLSDRVASTTRYLRHLSTAQAVADIYGMLCDAVGVEKIAQLNPDRLPIAVGILECLENAAHARYMAAVDAEKGWLRERRETAVTAAKGGEVRHG